MGDVVQLPLPEREFQRELARIEIEKLSAGMYFDRKGRPISLLDTDRSEAYRRVGLTHVTAETHISTVWLGLNHNFLDGPPHIFETMVFSDVYELDKEVWRWSTLRQAESGHRKVVRAVRAYLRQPLPLAKPHKTRNRHW